MIQLGDRVKDAISGVTGIVIGKTDWLYGCRRITVQPETDKDGKPTDAFAIDEPQAVLVQAGVITREVVPAGDAVVAPSERRAGPRDDASRRTDASR